MRYFYKMVLTQNSMSTLLKSNVGLCLVIFLLLQVWRPCFFLTDDNLSSLFPVFTEMGRHLKAWKSPFITECLFGGHYDLSRDVGYLYWHPFYFFPTLLSDTWARFWILDAIALLFILLTTVGFTILTYSLREEFNCKLSDMYLIFYTLSFVFSTYTLMTGASWINFLGNQSALPWLALGILNKKVFQGTALVTVFTIHQLLGAYAGLTCSNVLCLTLFAVGVALCRHSFRPLFIWCSGNLLGLIIVAPFMIHILDGFAHTARLGGLSMKECSEYFIPAKTFPFSFFLGNWSEFIAIWSGDASLEGLVFPYPSILLACAAAWCLVPAFLSSIQWRPLEILCLGMAGFLAVMIIRPQEITMAMHQIPFLKSMRWPFRECLQFQFFIHLFIVIRPQWTIARLQPAIALFSLAVFLFPLPFFYRVPTFNPLFEDRKALFSGEAEALWAQVKTQIKPSDEIATVIDRKLWNKDSEKVSYSLLGTANFPALYGITCISGYSTTAPRDQVPLKTIPDYWFGAFKTDQVTAILAEKPTLKLIRIENTKPLKITLSSGTAPPIDLSPYLNQK